MLIYFHCIYVIKSIIFSKAFHLQMIILKILILLKIVCDVILPCTSKIMHDHCI